MPSAYVFISVECGSEVEVFSQLKAMGEVKEAYATYGVYDLIAMVQTQRLDELKTTTTGKIQALKKVRSALSLITMDEPQTL